MKKYLPALLLTSVLVFSACTTTNDNKKVEASTTPQESQQIISGNYSVDLENSSLNWHAEKVIGNSHDGMVKIKSGEFSIGNNAGSGSIIIDMTSLKDDKNTEPLIKHLKSADFFDVEKFPESKLEITKISPTNEPNKYEVSGNLTIKDKTNPVSFTLVTVNSGDTITLSGNLSIDRTLWNVRFGSNKFFENLGDQVIRDEIDYNILVSAKLIK